MQNGAKQMGQGLTQMRQSPKQSKNAEKIMLEVRRLRFEAVVTSNFFHHGATEAQRFTQRIDVIFFATLRVFVTPWLNSLAAGKFEV